jgi:hypothetical protein
MYEASAQHAVLQQQARARARGLLRVRACAQQSLRAGGRLTATCRHRAAQEDVARATIAAAAAAGRGEKRGLEAREQDAGALAEQDPAQLKARSALARWPRVRCCVAARRAALTLLARLRRRRFCASPATCGSSAATCITRRAAPAGRASAAVLPRVACGVVCALRAERRAALQAGHKEKGAGDWSNYVPPSQTLAAIAARSRAQNGTISAPPQLTASASAAPAAEAPAAGGAPLPPLLLERLAARGIVAQPGAGATAAPPAPVDAAPATPAAPPPLPDGWVRAARGLLRLPSARAGAYARSLVPMRSRRLRLLMKHTAFPISITPPRASAPGSGRATRTPPLPLPRRLRQPPPQLPRRRRRTPCRRRRRRRRPLRASGCRPAGSRLWIPPAG